MNREILFKAKRIDNGEWVEGQYVYITNPLTEDGKPIKHLICNGTNIFNDLIDSDTICQCTGLTDKNDKKIWENDIVELPDEEGYFTCKWEEDAARFVMNGDGLTVDFDNYWSYQTEVAGNIFDNPELLEVDR
ncbi:YopX family protein [Mediterraneibacter gnavus]|nr:YopX family protein [Mediterraneibacter gnavus]